MTTGVKVRIQISCYITNSSALTFHYSPYGQTEKGEGEERQILGAYANAKCEHFKKISSRF